MGKIKKKKMTEEERKEAKKKVRNKYAAKKRAESKTRRDERIVREGRSQKYDKFFEEDVRKEASEKDVGGRPRAIEEVQDFDFEVVMRLSEMGFTNEHMAEYFKVGIVTFYAWLHKYSKFSNAIKDVRGTSNEKVEQALYHRATGYNHPEEKVFCTKDGAICTHDTIKHYPPDPKSMELWLRNRMPDKWRKDPDDGGEEKKVQEIVVRVVQGEGVASKTEGSDEKPLTEEQELAKKQEEKSKGETDNG